MKAVPVEKIEELVRRWRSYYPDTIPESADYQEARRTTRLRADELSALVAAAVDVPVEVQDAVGLVEQIKTDIVAMAHAEERIQFLEAVLYAVRGCAGTCAKCKELINTVDARGRSTADAEKASHP